MSTSLRLDDQLCFALYAASRAVTGVYRPLLERLGLTYPQYLVTLVLWEHGQCSIKELAAALQLDYGTLSPLLKRREGAGYVRRERRPDDERSVTVMLTEAVADLRVEATCVPPAISQAMALTAEETATLRDLLRRLTASTTAAQGGPIPPPTVAAEPGSEAGSLVSAMRDEERY